MTEEQTSAGTGALLSDETQQDHETQQTGGTDTAGEQQPTESAPWYGAMQDQDVRGWVEAKGWPDMESFARSAYNLEKMKGVPAEDLLRLPSDRHPDKMADVFKKLGMPESADKYQFDGMDEEDAWVKELAHKSNLTQQQFEKVAAGLRDTAKANAERAAEAFAAKSQAELQEWRQTKGAAVKDWEAAAREGVRSVGLTGEEVAAVERAVGTKRMMEMFAGFGRAGREGAFIGSDSQSSRMNNTPSGAAAQKAKLLADKDFASRWMSGEKTARDEITRLNSLILSE